MVARVLVKEKGKTTEEAAGIMLATALDATHKSILVFTEVIAYLLDHPKYWQAIQDLASQDTPAADEKLMRWVLEAQRIAVDLWIVRTPTKDDPNTLLRGTEGTGEDKKEVTRTVRKDDILVLKVKPASQDPDAFPNPSEINLDRPLSSYIYFGRSDGAPFHGKQLTLLGLTGLIKYAARLKRLRAAHDSCGKLKTVETPVRDGYWYMTVQWDQIVPFPSS
ncbi:MAG: fatty acid oxygenase [Lasallia pustulata]|uniref:Fatty acid oxygenase n=1 Tax=Lasallia pustulata TaxID=136370 RepID=A0A5M8PVW6_9LECA|nr:MAG: fatty acid oxygenase [Lasallia pustulata]